VTCDQRSPHGKVFSLNSPAIMLAASMLVTSAAGAASGGITGRGR